jgi:hypothetical protein
MSDAHDFPNLKSALGAGADCPPLPELAWALELGEADERHQRAAKHLAGCAHCQNEIALWREFSAAEPRPEEVRDVRWIESRLDKQNVVPRVRRRFAFLGEMRVWVLAASLVLVVGGVFYMRRGPGQLSVGLEDGVMRSQAVELVAPVGEIRETPVNFRWRAVPAAVRYEVRLLEIDRSEIWRGEAGSTSLPVPAAASARMLPGKTLLWEVRAIDASGKIVAVSSPATFQILRNSR